MRRSIGTAVAALALLAGHVTADDLDDLLPSDIQQPNETPALSDGMVKLLAKGFHLSPEEVRDRYGARIAAALKSATAEKPDSRPLGSVLTELLALIGTRTGGPYDDLPPLIRAEISQDNRKDPGWSALLKHLFWMCEIIDPSVQREDWPYPGVGQFEPFKTAVFEKLDESKKQTANFYAAIDAVAEDGPDRETALTKLQSYDRRTIERWIERIEQSDKERAEKARKAFARVWGDASDPRPAPPQRPRLPGRGEHYALLVAVADYDRKELRPLRFTRPDVLEMYSQLLESGYKPENIVLMHDDLKGLVAHYEKLGVDFNPKDYLPEGDKIRRELRLLLGRLFPADSVVVAFAGHGVEFRASEKSYFCPADARLEDASSLIAFTDVYAEMKRCRADRKLLLVDACQNDPQSELSRSRATVDLESVSRPQTEPVPKGIVAFFSCTAGQKSFEDPLLGHGIFFYHLLQGWKGSADLDGDGLLSYLELAHYTGRNTSEYAARKLRVLQTPELKAEFSGDWTLRSVPRRAVP